MAFQMPRSFSTYIMEFEPNATMHTAHHILLFGCSVVGYRERDTPRAVWDCGEMGGVGRGSQYRRAPVCSEGSHIIYAWARDAPKLTLPEGVGFKVGGRDSGINYLLLQVHYANVDKFIAGETENSGIILTVVPGISSRVTKRAGVLLLGTDGRIPAHKEVCDLWHGMDAASLVIAEKYINAFNILAKTRNTLLLPINIGDISSMVIQVSKWILLLRVFLSKSCLPNISLSQNLYHVCYLRKENTTGPTIKIYIKVHEVI
ncbi:peptidylglycine alpha-hydroxylating monooxygenase-like isoform X2 [Tachypleus tridentatus]